MLRKVTLKPFTRVTNVSAASFIIEDIGFQSSKVLNGAQTRRFACVRARLRPVFPTLLESQDLRSRDFTSLLVDSRFLALNPEALCYQPDLDLLSIEEHTHTQKNE